jgi:hypothetical protein
MGVIDFLKNVEMTPSPVRTRCHSSIPLIRTLHLSTTDIFNVGRNDDGDCIINS